MENISWTFEASWEYDIDKYVAKVYELLADKNNNVDDIKNNIADCIYNDLISADDLVFYSFGEEQYDEIINKILTRVGIQD